MKKILIPAFAAALLLCSCGGTDTESAVTPIIDDEPGRITNPDLEKASGTEHSDEYVIFQNGSTSPLSGDIMYMKRRYRSDSYTKSDLIICADGRIYCGFYMQNEGSFDNKNVLYKNGTVVEDDRLMDEKWLSAMLSPQTDDDFMLFGDIIELGHLPDNELSELTGLINNIDPKSSFSISSDDKLFQSSASEPTDHCFTFFVIRSSSSSIICKAFNEAPGYEKYINDENAKNAAALADKLDCIPEWEKACDELMVPYK